MKKTVLAFGVISGLISSILMLITMPFMDRIGFDNGAIVGYTGMVLSFLLVFFGIRSYRDNVNNGAISFGKALTVGMLIMLISCVFYVITWEIMFFKFLPDFWDKMTNHMMERVRLSGASTAEIASEQERLRSFGEMYRNPLFNAAFTFLEPLPVGLVMTFISALILRKKNSREIAGGATVTSSV
jgi:hypothetical protein